MSKVTIQKVKAILTAPAGINLIVVKVETSVPGLYGLGCATFAYREKAVKSIVEDYFDPLLRGRDAGDIEDLYQIMNNNSYWRNGPVTNNAISGVDMALWDIKGKLANMPLYELLGGRSRHAVAVYRHADGKTLEEIGDNVQEYLEEGIRYVRIQWGGYGGKGNLRPETAGYGGKPGATHQPESFADGVYYDPKKYMRDTLELFDYIRKRMGFELELLHDTHERLPAIDAVNLAKELEPFKLFFLEDILSPEQGDWFRMVRSQCATPIANGELYNNPQEWDYLIKERLIDFIRVHISQIGGISPARKLAIFCEAFGIRTAWHGPGDVSPVGHAANIHLDLVCPNFGIQEWSGFKDEALEVFPGCPELRKGFVYANDKPGLGIDINEDLAAKYPCRTEATGWTQTRIPDGTAHTP
jgi:mannonate dehydratase